MIAIKVFSFSSPCLACQQSIIGQGYIFGSAEHIPCQRRQSLALQGVCLFLVSFPSLSIHAMIAIDGYVFIFLASLSAIKHQSCLYLWI
jgi:hypothetical protein